MGMYDSINGEQIKVFEKIYATLSQDDLFFGSKTEDITSYISGGSLKNYKDGDEVPYQNYCYNLGKDFNIIDISEWLHPDYIIHIIRNGRVIETTGLDDIDDEDLNTTNYSYYGDKLNIKNLNDLKEFIKITEKCEKEFQALDRSASRNFFQNIRNSNEEEIEKLKHELDLENEKNEKIMQPFLDEKRKFFDKEYRKEEPFLLFGSILTSLIENKTNLEYFSPHIFLLNNISFRYLKDFLKDPDYINKYFEYMNFTDEFKEKVLWDIDWAVNYYEELENYIPDKENIKFKYDLEQIENCRYDELYKKYNLLPYKGYEFSEIER